MNKFIASQQKRDVRQDVVIWSRKKYQSRPCLCLSDTDIVEYWTYCAQFYADANCYSIPANSPFAISIPGLLFARSDGPG